LFHFAVALPCIKNVRIQRGDGAQILSRSKSVASRLQDIPTSLSQSRSRC
jgi:hypothetical protein